jgi:hypothetical protein
MSNNYTLGRGELHLARFKAGTQTPEGERYIGNSPEFSLNVEAETLDHYSSDRGIREKDDSIETQVNRMGSFVTDNVNPKNLALFFFGTDQVLTVAAAANQTESLADVVPGLFYQLGTSAASPSGARNITNLVIKKGAAVLVLGTDYLADLALGRIEIIEDGATIISGDDLTAEYTIAASTRERVISGNKPVEGSLRYIAFNPKGKQQDFFLPWVKITPNGDFNLKSDEWQQISFKVEALKKPGLEAVYIDGRPA